MHFIFYFFNTKISISKEMTLISKTFICASNLCQVLFATFALFLQNQKGINYQAPLSSNRETAPSQILSLLVREGVMDKMRLFPISSSSDSSPVEQSNSEKTQASLYLNIYDLTPLNNYFYWFGCGIFHSGIEAHGLEYGFGAHEYPTSGVFEVEPRSCPGFIFRRSILLGNINMSRSEFRSFMEHLSNKYHGDTYNLISKNCNHFTDEVCQQLTGQCIPGWVNRLARLGSFCSCLLPENIQATSVTHLPDLEMLSDDGAESCASSAAGENLEEDLDHHLLTTPNSDVALLKDKPVKLAKDIL